MKCLRAGLMSAAMMAGCGAARAASAAACGGVAMMGGAQIVCSHVDPAAPAQICTFSWSLVTTAGEASVVNGSFLLPQGANNFTVYQGAGFTSALGNPVVLCQGRKGTG